MIITTEISEKRQQQIDAIVCPSGIQAQAERILYWLAGRADSLEKKAEEETFPALKTTYQHYADMAVELFDDSCSAVRGELR